MINPSSGLSHQTSVTSPPPEAFPKATHEEAAKIIGDVTQGKHVIVLSGYSELEYENPEAVKKIISECLDKLISEHGQDNLVVVAGATKVGIGMVYEIAAQKNLATLGIVSENGRAYGGIAPDCKNIAWVPAVDKNNWEVLTPQGTSYMVDVAKSNGTFCALGGGAVTLSEMKKAEALGIPLIIHNEINPDPTKAQERLNKNPNFDPTPLRTWAEQQ